MLVGIANYEKGTTFKTDFNGNPLTVTNPVTGVSHNVGVRTSDAWGIGGGASYKIDLSAIGNKSYLELYALFGFGATNFSTSTDLGTITGFESAFVAKNPAFTGTLIDAGNAIQKQRRYRAGGFFVWNPNPIFSPWYLGLLAAGFGRVSHLWKSGRWYALHRGGRHPQPVRGGF